MFTRSFLVLYQMIDLIRILHNLNVGMVVFCLSELDMFMFRCAFMTRRLYLELTCCCFPWGWVASVAGRLGHLEFKGMAAVSASTLQKGILLVKILEISACGLQRGHVLKIHNHIQISRVYDCSLETQNSGTCIYSHNCSWLCSSNLMESCVKNLGKLNAFNYFVLQMNFIIFSVVLEKYVVSGQWKYESMQRTRRRGKAPYGLQRVTCTSVLDSYGVQ